MYDCLQTTTDLMNISACIICNCDYDIFITRAVINV